MRFLTTMAAFFLLASHAHADNAPLTPAQTAAVNQLVHDYLMNNPKVLAEALLHAQDTAKAEETAATTEAIEAHRKDLISDAAAPVLGNPSGDVTLVEFFDYRCPYCKAAAPIVDQLLQADPHIRIVMKEYPILGPDSEIATRIALVAAKHGKYAEVHDALLSTKSKVTAAEAFGIAKAAGLDPVKVKAEIDSADITADINRNTALAESLKIDGTPTFILGSMSIPGAVSLDDLRTAIAAIRQRKS